MRFEQPQLLRCCLERTTAPRGSLEAQRKTATGTTPPTTIAAAAATAAAAAATAAAAAATAAAAAATAAAS